MTVEDPGADANERAAALADRAWTGLLEALPEMGTSIGDERYDDRLTDPGPEGRANEEALFRGALDEIGAMDRDALDEANRITMDVLEAVAERFLSSVRNRTDRLVVASHMTGPSNLLGEIATLQLADTPERIDRFEARLRAFPTCFGAWAEIAREAVASGVTAPRVVVERSIGQLERILEIAPDESPALMPLGDDGAARERITRAVRDAVVPAHVELLEALRDTYLPAATETIGLSALPEGEALYATEMLSWTSLPLDAREVHELGLERFAAIQDERSEVAARLGFASPADAIAARGASGENVASSPEALVKVAEEQVARSWEAAPAFFGLLPSENCEVRRVEEFREADAPFAFYNPPTEDRSRPGVYYINAFDLEHRPLHHLAAVTYHEANPGHHFQIALEQELPGRSPMRRFGGFLAAAAFAEGWGLYSERLADEMDLYLDDWERLGMLEAQAHRAARLITDTGIHAFGWDREPAIRLLEEAGNPRIDAEIEVDRYIALPGQALSYMIGMIEIEQAREAAESREGFSLKTFHDRILSLGQLPLPALRRELGAA